MKELTIEQKAQRYDEAINKLHEIITMDNRHVLPKEIGVYLFPELIKEIEDERIRKWLIMDIKQSLDDNVYNDESIDIAKEALAWLEKQGETFTKKDVDDAYLKGISDTKNELEKQGEQETIDKIQFGKKYKCIASPRYSVFTKGEIYVPKDKFLCSLMNLCFDCFEPIEDDEKKPTDKVEPKFKVGDWVIFDNGNVERITSVGTHGYTFDDGDYLLHDDCDKNAHLWTIQDAKDGDVLAVEPIESCYLPFIAIYKERGFDFFNSHCFIGFDGIFYNGDTGHSIDNIHPATKEQRNVLMKAMTNAGYTFDFEKKELKKVVDEEQIKKNLQDNSFRRMFEQKPVWSEEDEKILKTITSDVLRMRQKCGIGTDEWSIRSNALNWLKYHLSQRRWKPTEKQLMELKCAIRGCSFNIEQLVSLEEQLEQL